MKNYLIILFFLFSVQSVIAQDLSSKSTTALEQMKLEAVEDQNYQLAGKIKQELKSRKSIDDMVLEKERALNQAVEAGNYTKASQLKKELARLNEVKEKAQTLKQQMATAIENEDYAKAQQLKEAIQSLSQNGSTSENKVAAENAVVGTTKIIFEETNKNVEEYDILMDGDYIYSVNKKIGFVIKTKPGKHTFKIHWTGKGFKRYYWTFDLTAEPDKEYIVHLDFQELKEAKRSSEGKVIALDPDIKIKQPTDLTGSGYTEFSEDTDYQETWDNFTFPFNYFTTSFDLRHFATRLPAEATGKFKLNVRGNFDFSLSRNFGLYTGVIFSEYLDQFTLGEEGYSSFTVSIGPSLTYYFVNTKYFAPFAGLGLPVTFANASVGSDQTNSTSLGATLRFGSHFFFSRFTGLTTQFHIGPNGGWGFSIGISSRRIPKKRAIYKRAYWY